MDFETRQKLAVEEINVVLAKYGLGLSAQLDGYPQALLPKIKFIDLPKKEVEVVETKKNVKETKKSKKGKK